MSGPLTFNHIGLTVPDLGEAVAFLVDHFGCEVVLRTDPGAPADADYARAVRIPPGTRPMGLALLRSGHGLIELFQYEGGKASFPANHDVGGHHLAFEVDDIEATLKRLEMAGVTASGPVRTARAPAFKGMRWVYVLAPFGLQLELVTLPNGPL